ncbi:hypothetical protein ACOSQ3_014715 [Xanthoceras sorbifolium]
MKCCSLRQKDLNFHYKKMSERYYMLNGNLTNITLGEIYQMALIQKVCQRTHLQIKCKPNKCSCSTKKKRHFLPKEDRKSHRFRYFRKKQ